MAVISGKGGTGKTSLTASFAALAGRVALADCDVDAADLHLLLAPEIRRREDFRCGRVAVIRREDCIGCGACLARCRFGAVRRIAGDGEGGFPDFRTVCNNCEDGCVRACPARHGDMIRAFRDACNGAEDPVFVIDPGACEGCGVCVWACPVKAIDFPERIAGKWYISDTRVGPMAHAQLFPGGENSGKLVTRVREAARDLAAEYHIDLVLVDGPPGVGCPVIASVTGVSMALVVAEPTLTGAHDAARALELTRHFRVPSAVCVNKWDVNEEMTERIEADARRAGASVAGRVRYDRAVTAAQIQGRSAVEAEASGAVSRDIRAVWENLAP